MLASLPAADPPLVHPDYVYEPKYDGIRAIGLVEPPKGDARFAAARLWSRLGNEKTVQFPELVAALGVWGRAFPGPVVLDGEIVALDAGGRPAGFQRLQNRIHVTVPGYRSSKPLKSPAEQPAAFILFDLIHDAEADLRRLPLTERRRRLERLIDAHPFPSSALRLSEQAAGDGRALYARAEAEGWEGLLVKRARSTYQAGRRSPDWQKMKINQQDEFVIGGWTEPRGSRAHFGSLVLGRYDDRGRLVHAGDVGTGFDGAELDRVWKLLRPLAVDVCPFADKPKTLSPAHWVEPRLVAQVRYTEITDDGRLRHPAYLGLRDDKIARDVTRPPRLESDDDAVPRRRRQGTRTSAKAASNQRERAAASTRLTARKRPKASRRPSDPLAAWAPHADALTAQLDDLERRRKDGRLQLPDGDTLDVTNLQKVFWPGPKYTKGDLIRYYARLAPVLLPVIDDRPLVMKRFPNGIEREAFYQHRAPDVYPRGVRVDVVPGADVPTMFVGGGLKTLLYMAQLASISMDPWFSTLTVLDEADQVAIDLDPQPGATFAQILDVARWVRDELERLGVPGYPKTSGSEGLHVFVPLPPGTSYEAGMLFCQIVATLVSSKHPKVATVERMVRRRKDGTVYVDYLQNIPGKTLACAYSARSSAFAGVSTPLAWSEIDEPIAPQDFTIATIEARVRAVGDLWAELRSSPPADLNAALDKLRS
jgi:bifunctional non-homologous end joining protein LigD